MTRPPTSDRPDRDPVARKIDPKLRMILNGGRRVNQLRAERCAQIRMREVDRDDVPRRDTDDRSASPSLLARLPDTDWEEPGSGGTAVEASVFVRLQAPAAEGSAASRPPVGAGDSRADMVTASLPLAEVRGIAESSAVSSIELAERVSFHPPFDVAVTPGAPELEAPRVRTSVPNAGGYGVVVGIIDVGGFDLAHPEFLTSDGATRFLEIWDQGGDTRPPPEPFGYGVRILRRHLQRAIDRWREKGGLPPTELEPQSLRMLSSHATHVASIAAGSHGVCPNADLVGVSLALPREDTDRRLSFYDSTRLAHAIDYVFEVAGDRPVSVNVSLGTNGHAHDGSSAINRWLEHALARPGRAICVAAGNAGQDAPRSRGDLGFIEGRIHTSGRIPAAGLSRDVEWIVVGVGRGDLSENELEIWYAAQDRFAVDIKPPGGHPWIGAVEPGDYIENEVLANGTVVSIYNELFTPANGANRISCYLSPFFAPEGVVGVAAGAWTVRLHGREVRDGDYHAWIERDDPRRFRGTGEATGWAFPSFLSRTSAVDSHSVNSLACGESVIAVANYDEVGDRIHVTSSQGPTRDGRPKPEVAAPGTRVLGANGFDPRHRWVRMTGTSMASPYVAGVVALMLELEPGLTAAQIAGILKRSARPLPGADFRWQGDAGFGVVDPDRCLQEVRGIHDRHDRTRRSSTKA